MRLSYKKEYLEQAKLVKEKDKSISELQAEVTRLNERIALKDTEYAQLVNTKDEEITSLKNQVSEELLKSGKLDEELRSAREKIRNAELNRFANEYQKEETRYESDQKIWFKYTAAATAVLLICAIGTALSASSDGFLPDPEIVFLNAILLTVFIYCLKQHSHLADLREDYANRKALAQSYQYMVEESEGEDLSEIKNEFFQKAIDVFTRRPKGRGSDVTWHTALIAKIFPSKQNL